MMRIVAILVPLVFLLLGLTQLAMMYRLSPDVIDRLLHVGAPGYLPLACVCWTLVLTGLAVETRRAGAVASRPPGSPSARILATWLDRLTGQPSSGGSHRVDIDAAALATALRQRIAGQDQVCEDVALQIRIRAAMASTTRPVGIFLFTGPPGSGKTLLGKCLAEFCHRELLHFDMAAFGEPHAASQMFGVPPGYVGSHRLGRLTAGLRDHPDAVVLLDEIEKAHPDVLRKFLVAWNDGHVTEVSNGRLISCTRAIFILTSNAGTEALTRLAREHADHPAALRLAAIATLQQHRFAPEVLDRIDRIMVFAALDRAAIARLADLEARALVRSYQLELVGEIDPALFETMLQGQYRSGAIGSARDVIRLLEGLIGDQLVAARASGTRRIRLVAQPDGIAAIAA